MSIAFGLACEGDDSPRTVGHPGALLLRQLWLRAPVRDSAPWPWASAPPSLSASSNHFSTQLGSSSGVCLEPAIHVESGG